MKNEREIRTKLQYQITCLLDWAEPKGLLIPTEPDPDERRLIRERLEASNETLKWILDVP